jgi:hypothetical protein
MRLALSLGEPDGRDESATLLLCSTIPACRACCRLASQAGAWAGGLMFWLRRNRLVGSYRAFKAAGRSYFPGP